MAALGLTMSAYAQKKEQTPEDLGAIPVKPSAEEQQYEMFAWMTDASFLGWQFGDKQAASPETWRPDGHGNFNGDELHYDVLLIMGYGNAYSEQSIYIRKQAYVESSLVRLGGRPVYRFNSEGTYIDNNGPEDGSILRFIREWVHRTFEADSYPALHSEGGKEFKPRKELAFS